jgi:hypothetical protein
MKKHWLLKTLHAQRTWVAAVHARAQQVKAIAAAGLLLKLKEAKPARYSRIPDAQPPGKL